MTIIQSLERAQLRDGAVRLEADVVQFAQRLIQTPSLSGDEQAVSDLMAETMKTLDYDDVWQDRAGNAIGVVRGAGHGPSVMLNCHMDHVAPGDLSLWEIPPYDAVVRDGVLYGRAASDVKGAMAAQVYSWPLLRELGQRPTGDLYVVGVVLEEVGGFGSAVLIETVKTDRAVVGEATSNELRRGHRGRIPLRVTFTGLSTHASAPGRGRNPHFAEARFLLALESLEQEPHATFGSSSAAPTLIKTDQLSANVTPGQVTLTVDWRNVPDEEPDVVVRRIQALAEAAAAEVPGITVTVEVIERHVRTYTGLEATMPPTRGFETSEASGGIRAAKSALETLFDRPVPVSTWTFSTDGGHLARAGIETVGFAPSEERFAHTIHDQVSVAQLVEAVAGNAALAMALTEETS